MMLLNIDGMVMTSLYTDDNEEILLELSNLFRYEINLERISKNGLEYTNFEMNSRFFQGMNEKIIKQYANYSIVREIKLVAAPEGWLLANKYHIV